MSGGRWGLGAALAGTVLLAIVGCTGADDAPTSSPSPVTSTPAPAPASTPDPIDPLTTVTALVLRAEAVELTDDDGRVVLALDYTGSSADAMTVLSTVFDGPPVDEPYRGTNHAPPGIYHAWEAVTLDERHYDEGTPDVANFVLYFDAPENRGIDLRTVQGYRAGDSWATLSSAPDVHANPSGCSGPYSEHVDVTTGYKRGVELRLTEDESTVRWLAAPVAIFLDGCP
ncbi:MAG: hypothetical protein ABWY36_03560 [Leifsonia sp.]